jgi:hypothetical protein
MYTYKYNKKDSNNTCKQPGFSSKNSYQQLKKDYQKNEMVITLTNRPHGKFIDDLCCSLEPHIWLKRSKVITKDDSVPDIDCGSKHTLHAGYQYELDTMKGQSL